MQMCASLMHRYCTNPAPITSQDTLILSHSFKLRLYQFGIVYHTPLFHYLILVCLRKALLNITYLYTWVHYTISLCYFMYPLHKLHKVS